MTTTNKNHFFFGYAGNKRNEFNNIYENFRVLEGIKTIYEPFAGTAAFSYFLSKKEPLKYEYVINDNNKQLIYLYKVAQDEKKLDTLIENINELVKDIDKEKYNTIIKQDTLEGFIIKNKIYKIRAGLFPLKGVIKKDFTFLKQCPVINFLRTEKITFLTETIDKIDEKYNKDDVFIFMDPPYLTECNDFYSNSDCNIYEYLCNNKITSFKCKIMLILSDNWIIRLLFKKNIKNTYDKRYGGSKKKINHLLINNY